MAPKRRTIIHCQVCGTDIEVRPSEANGHVKFCGAECRKIGKRKNSTHGLSATSPAYGVWMGMNARCSNPTQINYPDYGGRGIKVCERWQGENGFANFLADMGERPDGMTLDRKDNDGNYEPENCRWATWGEQHRNNRRTRNLTFRGETMCALDWSARMGININTLTKRLNAGWSIESALTTPISLKHKRN